MNQGCKCKICVRSCTYKPGWFLPSEVKLAAETLMMSEKEFFDKYLGVDWYEGLNDVFVLAPATTKMVPGKEYPADPRGQCIFFNGGLCDIHSVKPHECKESCHTDTFEVTQKRHSFVAQEWEANQDFIEDLLGYEPESSSYGIGESLSWI